MFDRQRRKVCIRDKIARGLTRNKQVFQERPVTFSWPNYPHVRLIQPALDSLYCLFQTQGSFECLPVGGDTDECEDHGPAETDGIARAELSIPPLARLPVGRASGVFGVQQQVRVDQNQRASSPSSCDRSS